MKDFDDPFKFSKNNFTETITQSFYATLQNFKKHYFLYIDNFLFKNYTYGLILVEIEHSLY